MYALARQNEDTIIELTICIRWTKFLYTENNKTTVIWKCGYRGRQKSKPKKKTIHQVSWTTDCAIFGFEIGRAIHWIVLLKVSKKRRSEWVSFSDFLWQVSINFPHFTVCFLFCHYFMSPVALLLQTVLLGTNEGKLMTGESSYAKPHRWRCTGIILHNSWGAIVLEDNRNQSDPVWEWIEALSSKFAESGLSHPIHSFQRRKWKKW